MALVLLVVSCLVFPVVSHAQDTAKHISIRNSRMVVSVSIDRDGHLSGDSVFAQRDWSRKYNQRSFGVTSDAGFKLNFMWTDWSAPGKTDNADNLVNVTQRDFRFTDYSINALEDGTKELALSLKGNRMPLQLRVVYRLGKDQFYARRKIQVRANRSGRYSGNHYLRKMWPLYANLGTEGSIVKAGGFGQPAAMKPSQNPTTGIFWGMEYPTAQNSLKKDGRFLKLEISDYYGAPIDTSWTSSNWVVIGLTPRPDIRQWFMDYVDDIRAQPVRPYLLYNSWYDLEAPQMVDDPARAMNEQNTLRSIRTLQKRLTQERGVPLDAFVLDDGWDVYKSDWRISDSQFPHGFKPLVKQLQETDTNLGVWFGPIGGYSHRNWRIDWMEDHNFEILGNDQLCLAGRNYHQLLKERVTDFTKNRNIGYFKWDGIQFSCSDPTHGHPIGIFSRRAIMDSVISLDNAVWNENPDAFLNITSGTWLSPWWVKYATTIWMQGGDYGYTDVPSISQRDRAITYRDFVLYNDFRKKDAWFPIANLMTHGIIKGRLQKLSAEEPLDKFTNNALLYFARGVSMWELYVSPDLLTDSQWDVLAQGIKWAKDRFEIMKHTVMVGGDPGKGEPYGYAHFEGGRGIMIMRNPTIENQKLNVRMDELLGLSPDLDSLVVERVYPQKWISPVLSASGSDLDVNLKGFETAIYEIYPLKDAQRPLLAGAVFESGTTGQGYEIKVLQVNKSDGGARLLNPEKYSDVLLSNRKVDPQQLFLPASSHQPVIKQAIVTHPDDDQSSLVLKVDVDESLTKASLATLFKTVSGTPENPVVSIQVDGKQSVIEKEEQQGSWGWYTVPLSSGSHTVHIQLGKNEKISGWSGMASLWFMGHQKVKPSILNIKGADFDNPIFPPLVNPEGTLKRQQKLGEFKISLK